METKEVFPIGYLKTRTGGEYYLLSPEPIDKDGWEHPHQQKFVVVPYHYKKIEGSGFIHEYSRHLITTDPDIEFQVFDEPIIVELSFLEVPEEEYPFPDIDEEIRLIEEMEAELYA